MPTEGVLVQTSELVPTHFRLLITNFNGLSDLFFLLGEGLSLESSLRFIGVLGVADLGGVGLGVIAMLVVIFACLALEKIEGFIHAVVMMNY